MSIDIPNLNNAKTGQKLIPKINKPEGEGIYGWLSDDLILEVSDNQAMIMFPEAPIINVYTKSEKGNVLEAVITEKIQNLINKDNLIDKLKKSESWSFHSADSWIEVLPDENGIPKTIAYADGNFIIDPTTEDIIGVKAWKEFENADYPEYSFKKTKTYTRTQISSEIEITYKGSKTKVPKTQFGTEYKSWTRQNPYGEFMIIWNPSTTTIGGNAASPIVRAVVELEKLNRIHFLYNEDLIFNTPKIDLNKKYSQDAAEEIAEARKMLKGKVINRNKKAADGDMQYYSFAMQEQAYRSAFKLSYGRIMEAIGHYSNTDDSGKAQKGNLEIQTSSSSLIFNINHRKLAVENVIRQIIKCYILIDSRINKNFYKNKLNDYILDISVKPLDIKARLELVNTTQKRYTEGTLSLPESLQIMDGSPKSVAEARAAAILAERNSNLTTKQDSTSVKKDKGDEE